MERNHNPNVVVMAKELYEELVCMARSGRQYNLARIDRHVRKFNPARQAARQEHVRKVETIRSQMIRDARAFKEQHVGKVVYARVDMLSFTKGEDPVVMPVQVIRVSKDRRLIDVLPIDDEHAAKYKRYIPVSANSLLLDLPEGYIKGVEGYHKYFIKENGPYDIRESVAEQERIVREATEKQDNCSVAYDVIGER